MGFTNHKFGGGQLEDFSPGKRIWTNMYFALTTLTTVGFGDYHPISDTERLIGSFMLLFGVATSSFLMGELLNIINKIEDDYNETNFIN